MDADPDTAEAPARDTPSASPLGRVPVKGPGRGLATIAALIGAVVLLSIVKPWDWGATRPAVHVAARSLAPATPGPSASADVTPEGLAGSVCLGTGAWEVATLETWRLIVQGQIAIQQVRVWRAVNPAHSVTDPGDPRIPIVIVAATELDALGWCAPSTGIDRPAGQAEVTLWRLPDDGSGSAGSSGTSHGLSLVPIRQIAPSGGDNRLAALYREISDCVAGFGCSGAGVPLLAPVWDPGRYVFRYEAAGSADTWWFGADVEILPQPTEPPAASSSGPGPAPVP